MIHSFPTIRRDLSLSASPFLRWLHATLRHVVEDSFEMRRRLKLHPNIRSTRVFREGPLEELFYDGRTLQALDDILMGETLSTSNITFVLFAYTCQRTIFHFSFSDLFVENSWRYHTSPLPFWKTPVLKCGLHVLYQYWQDEQKDVTVMCKMGDQGYLELLLLLRRKKCPNLCSPLHCEILGLGAIVSRFLI